MGYERTARRSLLPTRTIRDAKVNALAAARRGDEAEFLRLSLDLAGASDRLAELAAIRAALRALAAQAVAS